MKRILIFISFIFSAFTSISQGVVNNLVVFCNEGEPFTLIMNGERYNETPQTRVRVVGLTLKQYQVRIIFKNEKLRDHDTKLTFFNTGYECEFALNKRGRKKHTMDFFTEKRIEGFDQTGNSNRANYQNGTINTAGQDNSTGTQVLSSTPVNTVLTGPGAIPGINNNDPVNINSSDGSVNVNLGNEQFQIFKNDILKQAGDIAKEAKALSLLKNNLISSQQVKESMHLLSSEQAKVNYAKKMYPRTKDKENFYVVVNDIGSADLKADLQNFIQNQK